ncbi:MAG: pyruvate:ferredoxin (flavodoxin) oxidoreductase [Planctomycetota bacterium]
MEREYVTVDGNEAAAHVAHSTSEVIAIYPITPASAMGEFSDAWSTAGHRNIFGTVPQVIEMQSEAGAAGAAHGAIQGGALTASFTASQGLLLKIPNMFKIAGELTPAVFHIAARTVATHALSIFGDHSDVMAARSTGWAILASGTIQEVHDMAMVAHAATLAARVPYLHFFDGFRSSHEVNKIEQLSEDQMKAMMDMDLVRQHWDRALSPEHPVLRGSAQNPDVFFQSREAVNPFYAKVPEITQRTMDKLAKVTGRQYHLFDYAGAKDAERVIVLMGSGTGTVHETVDALRTRGEKVGVVKVHLFRPFSMTAFIAAIPATTKAIAVLDRTKEPGAVGEPLYEEVVTALAEAWPKERTPAPRVIGGRYGLSSKEFTPAMVKAVFDELTSKSPKNHFTVGIVDDVSHTSLAWDSDYSTEARDVTRAVFYGLGADGTVGANKNSVKIIGESTPLFAQGYFVYDSRKAGSVTTSHLRFGPRPIIGAYLIRKANFVACHQFSFLDRIDMLAVAEDGATFLLNSPYGPNEVWDKLPFEVQDDIIRKKLKFYVVDGLAVARKAGLGGRINTVMQTCFFALANVIPKQEAIDRIKEAIEKTYGTRGESVLNQNYAAVDGAIEALHEVKVPARATSTYHRRSGKIEGAPEFVQMVTAPIIAEHGDDLPVSVFPQDGTYPTGTTKYEKRSIAVEIPIWDPEICTQCGLCALVCPHAAIRTKAYDPACLEGAPPTFQSVAWKGKELADHRMTVQVAPDDCTGCFACVEVCPARSKEIAKHKAINMENKYEHLEKERANWDFFLRIPEIERSKVKHDTIKGSQCLQPLFEFSGACSGCGETPYVKLLTQLFGDRLLIGNATGCSSIYGGNLPTTPYTTNADGRGPAWSNSLFEDNAEFALGARLAIDQHAELGHELLKRLAPRLGDNLVTAVLRNPQLTEEEVFEQRRLVKDLTGKLRSLNDPDAKLLARISDALVRKSVWAVGGDGWAYDIGFGGLDHCFALGRDLNILVLDTEVYSNTGGQASKATPRAAVAKFAAGGKPARKKDLGLLAMAYGNVYVAQVALGANPLHTIRSFLEAESYRGPSLIIAYCHCIAHGIDMTTGFTHQKEAVNTGFVPLYNYDPREAREGSHPFKLVSRKPTGSFDEFAMKEGRFSMLARTNPEQAKTLFELARHDIAERWHFYEQMAGVERDLAVKSEEKAS